MVAAAGRDPDDRLSLFRDPGEIEIALVPVGRIVDRDLFFAAVADNKIVDRGRGSGKDEEKFMTFSAVISDICHRSESPSFFQISNICRRFRRFFYFQIPGVIHFFLPSHAGFGNISVPLFFFAQFS